MEIVEDHRDQRRTVREIISQWVEERKARAKKLVIDEEMYPSTQSASLFQLFLLHFLEDLLLHKYSIRCWLYLPTHFLSLSPVSGWKER